MELSFAAQLIDAIPAILAGNVVIIKPSEITPRFAVALNDAIQNDDELKTVIHFIFGDGHLGAGLIEQVDTICFTGSVSTGRKVAIAAAQNMIPAHLELGDKTRQSS